MPERPGAGSSPGFEDLELQKARGKPAQVPGTPGRPNADAFDRSGEAEGLRPGPLDGAANEADGGGDLEDPEATGT